MKENADKNRREVSFDVGDWVYVKLQPYRQTSLSGVKYHKLSKRYYGPYLVTARVGPVAYKLALPPHAKIHNVFHCSLLKLYEGPPPSLIDQLPPISVDNNPIVTPLAILDYQTKEIDGIPTSMALVQWQGLSPDDTSWENLEELQAVYNLEDKVVSNGEGIVMGQPKEKVVADRVGADKGDLGENVRPKRNIVQPKKWSDYVKYK